MSSRHGNEMARKSYVLLTLKPYMRCAVNSLYRVTGNDVVLCLVGVHQLLEGSFYARALLVDSVVQWVGKAADGLLHAFGRRSRTYRRVDVERRRARPSDAGSPSQPGAQGEATGSEEVAAASTTPAGSGKITIGLPAENDVEVASGNAGDADDPSGAASGAVTSDVDEEAPSSEAGMGGKGYGFGQLSFRQRVRQRIRQAADLLFSEPSE